MRSVTPEEFTALEGIEIAASADLYRAASDAAEIRELGGATCLHCPGLDPAALFRRVAGLGVGREASEAGLDEAIAYMRGRGERFAVTVAPQSRPPALASWLEKRGLTRGYAWMKFARACAPAPQATTDLEVRVVGAEHGADFGRVVAEGFGLKPAAADLAGALAGRPGWICVMAFAGGVPAAAGAAFVQGEYAWLGFGATLAASRRRGAQNTLLARRMSEAAARGARVAVTETGERQPNKPSHSYRNILRAGFVERYLRQNYLSAA
jgi:hypothetical protein